MVTTELYTARRFYVFKDADRQNYGATYVNFLLMRCDICLYPYI